MANGVSRIDVVATVIYREGSLLVVFNDPWGAFTLPMTKLRCWPLGLAGNHEHWELGSHAAMRNVGECLGITTVQCGGLLADVVNIGQSDRNGKIHDYQFQVYGFPTDRLQAAAGVTADWLTPDEILDPKRAPVSPTARVLVERLMEIALSQHRQFPPGPAPDPLRKSVASIAVISRGQGDNKEWFCQWNEHWARYFLVGGHQEEGETPEECLVREIQEELVFARDTDYEIKRLIEVLEYRGWSTSTWQETDYELSAFEIDLKPDALRRVALAPANRWITKKEIRSERCADDRFVSPTARKVLKKLGELR